MITMNMTIIIGVICKDGIVFGSDSQSMANRGVDIKRLNTTKIFVLNTDLRLKALVGGAGAVPFISKAIENAREIARSRSIDNVSSLVDILEEIMTALSKKYIVDKMKEFNKPQFPNKDTLRVQEEDDLPKLPVWIIVGGWDKEKKPSIYIVHPDGVGEKEEGFGTLGSGSAYAEYLLSQFYDKNISCEQGKLLVAFVIEEIKKIDPNVGGEVQLAVIKDNCEVIPPEKCKEVCERVLKINDEIKKTWKELIEKNIS